MVLVAGATDGGGADAGETEARAVGATDGGAGVVGGATEGRAGLGGGVDFRATGAGVSRRTFGGAAVRGVRTPDGGMVSARVVTPSGSSKTSRTCSMLVNGGRVSLFMKHGPLTVKILAAGAVRAQARSRMAAAPIPVPTHIVTMP